MRDFFREDRRGMGGNVGDEVIDEREDEDERDPAVGRMWEERVATPDAICWIVGGGARCFNGEA